MSLETWNGLILETRVTTGSAAQKNRGRFSGQKVHRVVCQYVIGVAAGYEPRPGTVGAAFLLTGKPVLFSCRPACGCTTGQMAGRPDATERPITCSKCS